MPEIEIVDSKEGIDHYDPNTIRCLDQGFVRLVDVMGDDGSVVQAARVSYGKGTKNVRQDKGLINYLMKHKHMSPFEMVEFKFHCKLPIFVARQWIRHRTASVNEISGRYSIMEETVWRPSPPDLRRQAVINRQGSLDEAIGEPAGSEIVSLYNEDIDNLFNHYHEYVKKGVAREVARVTLPLSTYTEWYWKMDLHNLLHFLELRMEAHAQKEIRIYAFAIAEFVKRRCPLTWEAFEEHRLNSIVLSRSEADALRKALSPTDVAEKALKIREVQLKESGASDAVSLAELAELRSKLTGRKLE